LKPRRARFNYSGSYEIVPLPVFINVFIEGNCAQPSPEFDVFSEFVTACVVVREAQDISK
jgi:hypothetical protein